MSIDERSLGEQLGRAVGCHQRGDLEGASRLYRAVLAVAPGQFDALHYLGLLEAQRGNAREALQWLKRATSVQPTSDAAQLNLANVQLELGLLDEALVSVQRAVQSNPRAPVAFNSQGVILLELGRAAQALPAFERALALEPGYADALSNRGNALLELKRADEALASYERALKLQPQAEQVWNNRGDALLELKRYEEAVASYDRALQLRPDYAQALHHRGMAHWERQAWEMALTDIERALQLQPEYAAALNSRGNVLLKLARADEALTSFERALQLQPDYVDALSNRGEALLKLQREDEALASCERALQLAPAHAATLNNIGNVWLRRGDAHKALGYYERALTVKPDYAVALNNVGNALMAMNRVEDALAAYKRALDVDRDHADALNGRAQVLQILKRHDEAIDAFSKLLAVSPDYPYARASLLHSKLSICDWQDCDALVASITDGVRRQERVTSPYLFLAISNSARAQLLCSQTYIKNQHPAYPSSEPDGRRKNDDRIRIAYLSADFHDHPVAQLLTPLIEQHDRRRFEVIGISFGGPSDSAQRRRLQKAFDRFVDVTAMSDPEVVTLLRGLEVDIAVDLMGHTAHARMGLWARRVAPVQVNYLGFPGTSGAHYLDYILADRHVIPQEQQCDYSEKVAYLPESFMPQERVRPLAERAPARAQQGLPEHGFVFCSFNNHAKISSPVFDIWMRLLNEIDGSVLWLSKGAANTENNLRMEAAKRGVGAERLVFASRTGELDDHLARHCLADLFLDTFPYNAHATASNALWAGLPVLTCPGGTFASRVAASLLHAVGLPELIASSPEDYEAQALRLATDHDLCTDYRTRLAHNRNTSPLFDVDRYRRHVEAAYMTMHEKRLADLEPAGFVVPVSQS